MLKSNNYFHRHELIYFFYFVFNFFYLNKFVSKKKVLKTFQAVKSENKIQNYILKNINNIV